MEGFENNNFVVYVDMVSEILCHKFHPYTILTGQTIAKSESYCVLSM